MEKEKRNQLIVAGLMLLIGGAIVYLATTFMSTRPVELNSISYRQAIEEMQKTDSKQAFYIGCRHCGHCANLEKVLKQFLTKHKDKNVGNNLIHKVEAGYSCIPETTDSTYTDYAKIFDFLVANKVAQNNNEKSFGTPQFLIVENGKVVDELDNYGRTVEGLEKLFTVQKYRGF